MNFKKIGKFLLYLLPWFLSAILFRSDTSYFSDLNKPFFAPPSWLFGIVWPILYLLITYVIYHTYDEADSQYKKTLLVNYISNQLFSFFFFTIKSNLLAFIDTVIVLISSYLFYKIIKRDYEKYSKYLLPYLIWNIYATILIISILAMN